jgi:transcriptional regulator with XRE-family HTH domain
MAGGTPDPEVAPSLGDRIRAVRTRRGLSVSELARRSEVSQSFLSQVEGGQSDISVGRLVRVAQALDVDVTELLGRRTGVAERVVRADQQTELPTPSEGLRLHLLAPSLDHSRTNAVGTMDPGSVAEPAYSTHGSESFVYILEGAARIELKGGRTITLEAGDSASYRSEEFERMVNPGRRRSLFVWIQASSRT